MGDGSGQSATGLLAHPPGQPPDKQTVRLPAVYAGPGPRQHLIAPDRFSAPFLRRVPFPGHGPSAVTIV